MVKIGLHETFVEVSSGMPLWQCFLLFLSRLHRCSCMFCKHIFKHIYYASNERACYLSLVLCSREMGCYYCFDHIRSH